MNIALGSFASLLFLVAWLVIGALAVPLLAIDAYAGPRPDAPAFPQYDIAKTCRVQADYAFAATLGQTDTNREISACSDRERENMSSARTFWSRASRNDVVECLNLAEGRYGRLARCLETSRSLQIAR